MLSQILQVTGALLILAGYGGLQGGKLHAQQVSYLLLNLGGSGILAALALIQRQWGFLLLEGVWAVVSLLAVVTAARNAARREPADRTVTTARTGMCAVQSDDRTRGPGSGTRDERRKTPLPAGAPASRCLHQLRQQ